MSFTRLPGNKVRLADGQIVDVPDWVTAGRHTSDYAPAGKTDKQLRRERSERARKAGIASGRARRELAHGRPPRRRERTRELALARSIPRLRQLSAHDFEAVYKVTCDRHGWAFDRRGFNTVLELYAVLWRRYRACGQDFEFTNEQLQRALAKRGRPRSRRTVQYVRQRLEAMGVFAFAWVKRGTWRRDGGWCAGERRDTVRATALVLRRANCTLRTEQEQRAAKLPLAPSSEAKKTLIPLKMPRHSAGTATAPRQPAPPPPVYPKPERDRPQIRLADGRMVDVPEWLGVSDQAIRAFADSQRRRPG